MRARIMRIFGARHHKTQYVRQCRVIGIAGCTPGSGVTHIAISAANYLTGMMGFRVAYVEVKEKSDIVQFLEKNPIIHSRCVGFSHMNVDYFPQAQADDVADIEELGYDFLICDLGVIEPEVRSVLRRCHRRIIIGSLKPWKYKKYSEYMRDLYMKDDSLRGFLYVIFLRKEEEQRFYREFGVRVKGVSLIEDPFRLKGVDRDYLERFTAEWF